MDNYRTPNFGETFCQKLLIHEVHATSLVIMNYILRQNLKYLFEITDNFQIAHACVLHNLLVEIAAAICLTLSIKRPASKVQKSSMTNMFFVHQF